MRHSLLDASVLVLTVTATVALPAAAAPVTGPNGHQYEAVLVLQGLSWFDAQAVVEKRGCGWYLATITSTAEDKFVFGLVKGKTDFFVNGNGPWTGGYQKNSREEPKGNWAWVTGEAFTHTNWALREPSNRTAGKQNAEPGVPPGQYETFLSHKANGQWNDHHPEALFHGYIAEFDRATQTACQAR